MDVRLPTEEAAYGGYAAPEIVRAVFGILTAYELARALEVTTETLGTWRNKDQGPKHVKLGKQVFYRFLDVEDWIDEQAGDGFDGFLEGLDPPTSEEIDALLAAETVAVKDPDDVSDGW